MSLPTFQELMLPALQTLARQDGEISIAGLEDEIIRTLDLSPEQRAQVLPNGNQTVLANRLNWARAYLSKAGLIEVPRRGYCRASERGRKLLAEGVSEIDVALLERYPEFIAWKRPERAAPPSGQPSECPEELIASTFELLNV